MRIEKPEFEDLTILAREQFELELERDRLDVNRMAAIGLTVLAWRNTKIEDLHAGSHPSGGFPDTVMMRSNIATFRVVLDLIGEEGIDWFGLEGELSDPDRPLAEGLTVGKLCGDEFDLVANNSLEILETCQWAEEENSPDYMVLALALQAGISTKGWFGSPWWEDVIEKFMELVDADGAALGEKPMFQSAESRRELKRALLFEPETLDDDSLYWCMGQGLDRKATFRGFAEWRRRRDPEWVDPSPFLSE